MTIEPKPKKRPGVVVKVTVSELVLGLLLFTVLAQSLMLTILLLNDGR